MNVQLEAALRIWRGRRSRTGGDLAFAWYAAFMVGLVAIVPAVRLVWVSAISEAGIDVLASSEAPAGAMLVVTALWSGALLLGRERGPALRSPFLTHALASSRLSRARAFGRPVLRAGLLVTALATLAAALVGGSLAYSGAAGVLSAVTFTAVGALVGVIATVAWLAGQGFPRISPLLALGVLGLGVGALHIPSAQSFTPSGWVGLAYPSLGSPFAMIALLSLTVGLVAVVPAILGRIRLTGLSAQAARWEAATRNAMTMELGMAANVYQHRPHLGRRVSAVRRVGRLRTLFLVRDAIGATRTPARLAMSLLALAAAGVLVTLAFAPTGPGWLIGAAAGVLIFFGLSPLTDGVRHAASVAGDLPLYGISDERLLVNHALFPFAVLLVVLLLSVAIASLCMSGGGVLPGVSALVVGWTALVLRVSGALKGPMPPKLLAPIPSPAGDLSVLLQLSWALDGVLLAAVAGAASVLLFQLPVLSIGVSLIAIGTGVSRWRQR